MRIWCLFAALVVLPVGMLTDFNSSAVAHDTIGAVDAPISVDEIRAHIAILASDDFGGRAPGTIGEQKTIVILFLGKDLRGMNGKKYWLKDFN